MKTLEQLEKQALDAHAQQMDWGTFYPTVVDDIRERYRQNPRQHKRTMRRLLSLVVSGDNPKTIGVDDPAPWLADDAQPSDTLTQADAFGRPLPGRVGKSQKRKVFRTAWSISSRLPK